MYTIRDHSFLWVVLVGDSVRRGVMPKITDQTGFSLYIYYILLLFTDLEREGGHVKKVR